MKKAEVKRIGELIQKVTTEMVDNAVVGDFEKVGAGQFVVNELTKLLTTGLDRIDIHLGYTISSRIDSIMEIYN